MKIALQSAILFILSSLLSVSVFEVGLRIWAPEPEDYLLYQFDPVLGWINRQQAQIDFRRDEFRYPVKINSVGMWDREINPKRSDEFRIAFLGDSFTWGWGAAYGERFTEILELQNPAINALNFGVPGYGPVQYLLQLDRDLELQPDYVVLVFCLGNDLTDNLVSSGDDPKPYAVLSDSSRLELIGYPLPEPRSDVTGIFRSRVVTLLTESIRQFNEKSESSLVERPPFEILYAPVDTLSLEQLQMAASLYRVNEALLDALRERVDTAIGKDRFAVLLAPTKFEQGEFLKRWPGADRNAVAEKMLDSLARLKIPVLDGRRVINRDDFWILDGHWRPSGHRKIGMMLAEFASQIIARKRHGGDEK
jgi:lysophospholipase L1-like esterase